MKKMDRKQMQQVIVLGVLFLAAMGYAAYQLFFTGSTSANTKGATTTTSEQQAKEAEPQTTAPPWLSSSEPMRDPFVIPPQFDNLKQNQVQTPRQAPRVASVPSVGTLPPMPVTPVSSASGSSTSPVDTPAPSTPQQETQPNITVTGVVVGERPVAILRSEGGNQRIVQPGHQLEGGYLLRTVSRDGVVLEKDGKTVTLRPGGNPNAK
ncbi:MAG: hypothetical protein KatS3mg023_3351 [Armatimonadota bacterium]|nr:MAG: hypothetical protein KatS3mg023_3351 [Armatimonadota bacterium]